MVAFIDSTPLFVAGQPAFDGVLAPSYHLEFESSHCCLKYPKNLPRCQRLDLFLIVAKTNGSQHERLQVFDTIA